MLVAVFISYFLKVYIIAPLRSVGGIFCQFVQHIFSLVFSTSFLVAHALFLQPLQNPTISSIYHRHYPSSKHAHIIALHWSCQSVQSLPNLGNPKFLVYSLFFSNHFSSTHYSHHCCFSSQITISFPSDTIFVPVQYPQWYNSHKLFLSS